MSSFWWLVILSIFLCICWPFVCLVWKNVYSDPLTIFKVRFLLLFLLLLGCTSSLYTLTSINPLLDMICKYVLPFKCCLLLLLIVFFTVQKVFLFDIVSLIWSQSLYIYILLDWCQGDVCLCVFLGVSWFLVLHLSL